MKFSIEIGVRCRSRRPIALDGRLQVDISIAYLSRTSFTLSCLPEDFRQATEG